MNNQTRCLVAGLLSILAATIVFPPPGPAHADCVSYAGSTNTINVTCDTTLDHVDRHTGDSVLDHLGSGEYLLNANITVADGGKLTIDSSDVSWLKITGQHGLTAYGRLVIDGVKITSWDPRAGTVVEQDSSGSVPRPYIHYKEAEGGVIRDSEIAYIGYSAPPGTTYKRGVTLNNTTDVQIKNSSFHHMWYAFYSNSASDIVIDGSEYHHNLKYAIDPHTGTRNMQITDNRVHDNVGPGIICSFECYGILIEGNEVADNTQTGIFLSRDMQRSIVRDNVVTGSVVGIVVSESSDNWIYGNTISASANGIYVTQPGTIDDGYSRGNSIHDNTIRDADYAIKVSIADGNVFRGNDIGSIERYEYYLINGATITIEDQSFSDDGIHGSDGTNRVVIDDSGTIAVNGSSYDTSRDPYDERLTNQQVTVDSQ